jgi:hypothetical protein
MTDETFIIKGETHYIWPHDIVDGYSVRCDDCRYFVEDEKNRSGFAHIKTGKCHSEAFRTDRRYITVGKGWIKKLSNGFCRWWFPIEKQAGENETFID